MKDKAFEIIEHTADIGIRVFGRTLKDLFRNAGLAIFRISTERITKKNKQTKKILIIQKADNREELLVNWLNELLSLSAARGVIFEGFAISRISENMIKAAATTSDIGNYKVNTEIKAATYYGLKIKDVKSGYQAQVILDV